MPGFAMGLRRTGRGCAEGAMVAMAACYSLGLGGACATKMGADVKGAGCFKRGKQNCRPRSEAGAPHRRRLIDIATEGEVAGEAPRLWQPQAGSSRLHAPFSGMADGVTKIQDALEARSQT